MAFGRAGVFDAIKQFGMAARADLGVAKPGEAADAVPRGSDLLF